MFSKCPDMYSLRRLRNQFINEGTIPIDVINDEFELAKKLLINKHNKQSSISNSFITPKLSIKDEFDTVFKLSLSDNNVVVSNLISTNEIHEAKYIGKGEGFDFHMKTRSVRDSSIHITLYPNTVPMFSIT